MRSSTPDNVKLTDLVLTYPQRCTAEDGVFDLEYTYSKEGLLTVRATLQKTGQVVLDGEVKVFGDGNVLPEVKEELNRLLALALPTRPAATPTHPPAGSGQRAERARGQARPTAFHPTVGRQECRHGAARHRRIQSRLERAAATCGRWRAELRGSWRQPYDPCGSSTPSATSTSWSTPTLRHDVAAEERPLVEAAIADGTVVQPPAGTEGRGDALVISIADEVSGVIVSNDNFAPFQRANPWLRDAGRVMGATHSQGVWVFNRRTPNFAPPTQRR